MDCDIKTLSKEELSLLLESIPRKAYLFFGKPSQVMVSGFRNINKIPNLVFYNNIKKLIDKDNSFVGSLNKFLGMERNNILKEVAEYEKEQGYDHISAYGKVIEKAIREKYRALYLKLFGEDESDAKAILRSIEAEAALESKIKAIVAPMIPEPDKRIDALKAEVSCLKTESAKLAKTQKEIKEMGEAWQRQIRSDFSRDLKANIAKVETGISALSSSLKKAIADFEKKLASKPKAEFVVPTKEFTSISKAIEGLSKRVADLEDAFAEIPSQIFAAPNSSVSSPFEIITVPQVLDIDVSDEEFLGDNIIDVAEGRIPHGSADMYRSAILECIYSDRPIVAAGKAAKHLAEEISGVLTGQIYHRVKLISRNFEYADLIDAINKICKEDEPSVILVEGVLGKGDLTDLLRCLKRVAPRSKFIFSLSEPRFVKFLDPSVFAECLYFGGVFKDEPSLYVYKTSISDRPEIETLEFDRLKEALGIRNGFAFKLHQKDWSGLATYCLLPYMMDYGQVALADALARIPDPDLRRKCKEVLDV